MKKTYLLTVEGKNRDRLLEASKHDIRKYVKRQRRAALPPGTDYWDFDCKLGTNAASAQAIHFAELTEGINQLVAGGADGFYVDILGRAAVRAKKRGAESDGNEPDNLQ